MSHHQTYHKHEPEPEPEPEPRIQCANLQRIPLPTPPRLAIPTLAQQLQPMMRYTNPQMTLLYGLTPPGFKPVNARAKQSASNSSQVEPFIRSKNAGKKPSQPLHGSALAPKQPGIQSTNAGKKPSQPLPGSAQAPKPPGIQSMNAHMKPTPPLHGSALAPKPPGIQSMNAHKKPTPPLHGSALNTAQEQPCIQYVTTPAPSPTPHYGLAPNPKEMVVRSSGENSSGKIKSNDNSNKHIARFRYRPYPMPEKPMNEKPKHDVPPPFDLNDVYQGKPLSIERTGPPVLEARRENTPTGDGSLPLVLEARRGKRPVGDIPGSTSVPEFPSGKENLDLSLHL